MKKNIVLTDWDKDDLSGFISRLEEGSGLKFKQKTINAEWGRNGKIKSLLRYVVYFLAPVRFFITRRRYSTIVGWQQFYALIFCFYCSLFHVEKTCRVVAWNFTYKKKKGILGALYKAFMKRCVCTGYLDYLHVPSYNTADDIARDFGFPRDHIIVAPFGINDEYEKWHRLPPPEGHEKDGYVLAIGRSNRDYDFLIRAWEGIEEPLVIINDTLPKDPDNPYIEVRRDVDSTTQYPWISNCRAVVIPIDDPAICSGDTVLLMSMCLEKPIIVTGPSTLQEMYITDRKNGLAVNKDPEDFRKAVKDVLNGNDPDLGSNARASFLSCFTREQMGITLGEYLKENR